MILCLILLCRGSCTLGGHIESVFAVLIWKCGSFLDNRATNSTHFLYMYESNGTFGVYASRITGVGHCFVYCCHRSFHNLQINERKLSPHFLFYTNPPHRRFFILWRKQTFVYKDYKNCEYEYRGQIFGNILQTIWNN